MRAENVQHNGDAAVSQLPHPCGESSSTCIHTVPTQVILTPTTPHCPHTSKSDWERTHLSSGASTLVLPPMSPPRARSTRLQAGRPAVRSRNNAAPDRRRSPPRSFARSPDSSSLERVLSEMDTREAEVEGVVKGTNPLGGISDISGQTNIHSSFVNLSKNPINH